MRQELSERKRREGVVGVEAAAVEAAAVEVVAAVEAAEGRRLVYATESEPRVTWVSWAGWLVNAYGAWAWLVYGPWQWKHAP